MRNLTPPAVTPVYDLIDAKAVCAIIGGTGAPGRHLHALSRDEGGPFPEADSYFPECRAMGPLRNRGALFMLMERRAVIGRVS